MDISPHNHVWLPPDVFRNLQSKAYSSITFFGAKIVNFYSLLLLVIQISYWTTQ